MKKLVLLSQVGVLTLLFLGIPFLISAQETQEPKQEKEKKTASFDPYWFLNINGGLLLYHGDIASPDDKGAVFPNTDDWNLGYGLGVGYQIGSVFGLRLHYQGGKLEGTKADDDVIRFSDNYYNWHFETKSFHNPRLTGVLNLSNLIGGYNPDRFINFNLIGGIGLVMSKGELHSTEGNEPEITMEYLEGVLDENEIKWIGDDLKTPESRTTYNIPVGVGIDFRLTQKLDLNLESTFSFTGSDEIDNFVDDVMPVKNDMFSYTSLGLTYKLISTGNLNKMVEDYGLVKYEVIPDPLVNTCTDIPVTIKGTFPEKYFNKKAVMQFAPVLKWDGGSYALDPIYLQGENVVGDGKVIPYDEGGTFTYNTTIPYKEGMEGSELVVDPVAYLVKTTYEPATREVIMTDYKYVVMPERKIADGTIMPKMVIHDEQLLYADKDTYTKLGLDPKEFYEGQTYSSKKATIWFIVDRWDLNWNMPLNKNAAAKAQLDEFKQFLASGPKLRNIEIDAWASPEGEESHNEDLSQNRAKTGHNYLIDFYKKMAKDKKSTVKLDATKDIKFDIRAHGEDWDGFVKAVEASNLKDKNVILNVVKSQPNVARREQEIKNMALVYKEIEEDILPPLRRTEMKAWVYDPFKTDAEILNLSKTDPSKLTQKELLYAATLTNDLAEKEAILKKYIELYPNDCKGYNNLAWVYLKQDKLDDAKIMLEKAEGLCPNNPVVLNNFGAYYSKIGDYTKAETYYTKAKQYGAPVGYNMGIIQTAQCKYDQALTSFAGSKCTFNIALAKFQKGDYKGAESELNCAEPSAKVDYMKAVIGARTDNAQMVIENLTKAVKESDKCKKMAGFDREFIKYWDDPNFQALIK
jgi:hypothetical protein